MVLIYLYWRRMFKFPCVFWLLPAIIYIFVRDIVWSEFGVPSFISAIKELCAAGKNPVSSDTKIKTDCCLDWEEGGHWNMCRLVAFVTLSTPTQHSVTRLHNYSSHNTPSALIYYVSVRWRQPLWKLELIQCQNSASRIIIDDACLNIRQLPASCSGYFNQLLQKHHSCRLAKRLGLYLCLKRAGTRQE